MCAEPVEAHSASTVCALSLSKGISNCALSLSKGTEGSRAPLAPDAYVTQSAITEADRRSDR
jgi:hypothetical protein